MSYVLELPEVAKTGALPVSVHTTPDTGKSTEKIVRVGFENGVRATRRDRESSPGGGALKPTDLSQNITGRKPLLRVVDSRTRFTAHMAVIAVDVAEKQLPSSLRLTTLTTMVPSTGDASVVAAIICCCGSNEITFPQSSRSFAGTANGERDSQAFVLIREPVTTSPIGRRAERPEAVGTLPRGW